MSVNNVRGPLGHIAGVGWISNKLESTVVHQLQNMLMLKELELFKLYVCHKIDLHSSTIHYDLKGEAFIILKGHLLSIRKNCNSTELVFLFSKTFILNKHCMQCSCDPLLLSHCAV